MRRTMEIATANLSALSGDDELGGPLADGRELGAWFAHQLEDDAIYLEAARERATQGGGVDRPAGASTPGAVHLGLTGVIGAILMVLAAIQSLEFTVPLPPLVKPAVVTTLGAVALLFSLVVLRVTVPDRRWPLGLVWAGAGFVAGWPRRMRRRAKEVRRGLDVARAAPVVTHAGRALGLEWGGTL